MDSKTQADSKTQTRRTIIVRAGEHIYAIPLSTVALAHRITPDEIEMLRATGKIELAGHDYLFHELSTLCGDGAETRKKLRYVLILLHSGERYCALQVDALLGLSASIVKGVGDQLSMVPGIIGATIDDAGAPIIILDPVQMSNRAWRPAGLRDANPVIMVVDASTTVRKGASRLLTRAGYRVVAAKDGVDAIAQIERQHVRPAAMLIGSEMPRMNGFELTRYLRCQDATRDTPIIMITSRAAAQHRDYATQIGVDAYFGKPYQEDELLAQVEAMTGSLPAFDLATR